MKTICISIPVHERGDVVVDQIKNMQRFYEGSRLLIVLHISQSFKESFFKWPFRDYDFRGMNNVFINPTQYPTRRGNLVHIHNSNFSFITEREKVDYVVLHSSNDLYIRAGASAYIESAKNGVHQAPTSSTMPWIQGQAAYQDEALRALMQHLYLQTIYGTQPEGIFFEASIFKEMVDLINRFFNPSQGKHYCREEIYYSTLAAKFCSSLSSPLLYSEMCRKPITKSLIHSLVRKNYKEEEHDDNGAGRYHLYDFSHLYAVKRIPRLYHHHLRRYVRAL